MENIQKNRMELTAEEMKQIYQSDSNETYRNYIIGLVQEAIVKKCI